MTKSKQSAARGPARPLWRRIVNRHSLFGLHIVLWFIGGSLNWTLPAQESYKQFDMLTWMILICAHGLALYYRKRWGFLLHLLMYASGNGTIWLFEQSLEARIFMLLTWLALNGVIGLILFRYHALHGNIGQPPRLPSLPRLPVRRTGEVPARRSTGNMAAAAKRNIPFESPTNPRPPAGLRNSAPARPPEPEPEPEPEIYDDYEGTYEEPEYNAYDDTFDRDDDERSLDDTNPNRPVDFPPDKPKRGR
jgi:hypothetical protein